MRVVDAHGTELRAEAGIGKFHGRHGVFLHSRGGSKDSPEERNPDYAEALTCLIRRLIDTGQTELHAWVASSAVAALLLDATKIRDEDRDGFPLQAGADPVAIQRWLSNRMSTIGQAEGAKGGNPTRRIFIQVPPDLCAVIIVGRNLVPTISPADIDAHEGPPLSDDHRENALRAITVRRGQQRFRRRLLEAYGHACAVSGCRTVAVLEAAHISPYLGEHTNRTDNGILLRADLHTLFDLNLLHIGQDHAILLAPEARQGEYARLHGSRLRLPAEHQDWPSSDALKARPMPFGILPGPPPGT